MTSEHALLGVLAAAPSGASHGYDLARSFAPDAPLGSVLHLEAGMVYHHVKKLERLGWVQLISDGGRRPGRRTVVITDEGRAELRRWLAEPVRHTREVRLEFLVKLRLALQLDLPVAHRLVGEQHAVLGTVREGLDDTPLLVGADPSAYGALVRDLRARQTESAIAWLESVQDHLGE
ncbi:MAG: PadR family transcriptional regulator [Thermomicrobiales bacterium]|nr:PadR family transcriptional regulator [Thermomicrobiales bacterium]